jgi:hypothetical protein
MEKIMEHFVFDLQFHGFPGLPSSRRFQALLVEDPKVGYRKLHEKLKTEEDFKELSLKKADEKNRKISTGTIGNTWGGKTWLTSLILHHFTIYS